MGEWAVERKSIMSEHATQENKIVVVHKDDSRVLEALAKLRDIKNVISDGLHEAIISAFEYREMIDNFKKCETIVLVPTFNVTSDDGEEATLNKYISLTWSDKSNLKKLAKATNALPLQGEAFDPDNLIGARVILSVENEEKDSRTISKIVDFFPSKIAKKVTAPAVTPSEPSRPIVSATAEVESDEDFENFFEAE